MQIRIEMDIPRRLSRLILAVAIVAIVGVGALVRADVPNIFKPGDTLSAQKLNDNFAALQKYIDSSIAALPARPSAAFGDFVARSGNTVYQAATDGFVVAYNAYSYAGILSGLSDPLNPPTVVVQYAGNNVNSTNWSYSIMFPVKKGNYYKVAYSGSAGGGLTVYWMPVGS